MTGAMPEIMAGHGTRSSRFAALRCSLMAAGRAMEPFSGRDSSSRRTAEGQR